MIYIESLSLSEALLLQERIQNEIEKQNTTELIFAEGYKSIEILDMSGNNSGRILQFIINENNVLFGISPNSDFIMGKINQNNEICLFEFRIVPEKTVFRFEGRIKDNFKIFGSNIWRRSTQVFFLEYLNFFQESIKTSNNVERFDLINDEKIEGIENKILDAYQKIGKEFPYIDIIINDIDLNKEKTKML